MIRLFAWLVGSLVLALSPVQAAGPGENDPVTTQAVSIEDETEQPTEEETTGEGTPDPDWVPPVSSTDSLPSPASL